MPIVVTISDLVNKRDFLDNEVIESVVRVFFPTMENLKDTIQDIKKKAPKQIKCFRQSYSGDVMAVAKTVFFSIGAEGTKQIVAAEELPPPSLTSSTSDIADGENDFDSPVEESLIPLYPTIITISEPIRKTLGTTQIQVIETTLSVYLVPEWRVLATERLIARLEPTTEIQTHFRSNIDTVGAVADFMVHEEAEQRKKEKGTPVAPKKMSASADSTHSLLSAVQDEYFSPMPARTKGDKPF